MNEHPVRVLLGEGNPGNVLARTAHDAIKRKRTQGELHKRAAMLVAVHETARELAARRELPGLLQTIVTRAVDLLRVSGGEIYLYRPASDDLELAFAYPDHEATGRVLRCGEGLAGKVLEGCRALTVADHSHWEGRSSQHDGRGLAAGIGVSICWEEHLLGVLHAHDDDPREFSPADVALLEIFASLAAAALENHRLYADLQQQVEQLKATQTQLIHSAKLAAVGELVTGVAHELNNPLTSVLGFSEFLLEELSLESPHRKDLETIANEARRARDIVRNLLDFARRRRPLCEVLDLREILSQTLDLVGPYLVQCGISIETVLAPGLFVAVDESQMKQVLLNLINNAAQAMPGGGRLLVHTTHAGDGIAVSITDTGVGMSPEVCGRLFQPFFTTKSNGMGLGLSISLGIVQAHGGRITVESAPGRGSTFTVWLPAGVGDSLQKIPGS